jgi:hypothetical protein
MITKDRLYEEVEGIFDKMRSRAFIASNPYVYLNIFYEISKQSG